MLTSLKNKRHRLHHVKQHQEVMLRVNDVLGFGSKSFQYRLQNVDAIPSWAMDALPPRNYVVAHSHKQSKAFGVPKPLRGRTTPTTSATIIALAMSATIVVLPHLAQREAGLGGAR